MTTRQQSIANPIMEDCYARLHMNIDADTLEPIWNKIWKDLEM